jgi:hypothetical protein
MGCDKNDAQPRVRLLLGGELLQAWAKSTGMECHPLQHVDGGVSGHYDAIVIYPLPDKVRLVGCGRRKVQCCDPGNDLPVSLFRKWL